MKKESSNSVVFQATLSFGALSDRGRVRDENQDTFLADPDSGLFLVSDGIAGHQGGTLAAKIVTEVLPVMLEERLRELRDITNIAVKSMLKKTILELNRYVRAKRTKGKDFNEMGATLVMALLRDACAYIANIGDSRAYLFRENKLSQLTEDHNIVGLFLRQGLISKTRARFKYHPGRCQLTRCIGMQDKVCPYVCTVTLERGDRLLLCTDGLTGLIYDKEIAAILKKYHNPQIACQKLIDTANDKGGYDNVTGVIIDWYGNNNDDKE